jgi:hypothetical protein
MTEQKKKKIPEEELWIKVSNNDEYEDEINSLLYL